MVKIATSPAKEAVTPFMPAQPEDGDERYSRQLLSVLSDAVLAFDGSGRVTYWNAACQRLLGYTEAEVLGHDLVEVIGSDIVDRAVAHAEHLQQPDRALSVETEMRCRDGSVVPVEFCIAIFSVDDAWHATSLVRDLRPRRATERALRESENNFRNLVEKNHTGIIMVDDEGRCLFSNPAAQHALRRTAEQLLGAELGVPLLPGGVAEIQIFRANGEIGVAEMTASSTEWHGQAAYLVMLHDVTDRRDAEVAARHMALHDSLTGLANRTLFVDTLALALRRAQRDRDSNRNKVAVLFCDLDRFKWVNDTLGHAAGDQLLKEVAQRIVHCVRESDSVARLGGDEFALILEDLDSSNNAISVADKILEALRPPHRLQGEDVFVSASIGISLFPDHGVEANTLVKRADSAMYRAKSSGNNAACMFWSDAVEQGPALLRLESRLRRDAVPSCFSLNFQPQVRLHDRALIGVEALIRWNDPELGPVPPDRFIPLLERIGLIRETSRWVLRTACDTLATWREHGLPLVPVAINLSASDIEDEALVDVVTEVMRETGTDARWLHVEVTETMLMEHKAGAATNLARLREIGISTVLDDFGTGYSSLSYLNDFEFDQLKIDRSFISASASDQRSRAIVSSIIAMGGALGLEVLAEGIETPAQDAWLRSLGCEYGQGYLFAKPLPETSVRPLLSTVASNLH